MTTHHHTEHDLQTACVKWFEVSYSWLSPLFFSVPNGAKTKLTEARWMKAEGMKPGVADILLLVPNGEKAFLCIEMKSATGRQSAAQRNFQEAVTAAGGQYTVCRTFEEFSQCIKLYAQSIQPGSRFELIRLAEAKLQRRVLEARAEYNKLKNRNHE